MKTFWQKVFPVTCVAVIMFISVACSPDVAADPTPDTTTEPAPPPSVTTVTSTPSPAPTKTPTPSAKITPTKPAVTKKPTVKPESNQITLYPMWETEGDPGGAAWGEAGIGGLTKNVSCDKKVRDQIDLELNGSKEVRGSLITVTETAKGTVIRTNSVLPATALIVNREAATKVPNTWWDKANNPSKKTILLPKANWKKAVGGETYIITACVIRES